MSGQDRRARLRVADVPADPGPRTHHVPDHPDAAPGGLEALYRRHAAWLRAALARRFGRERAEDLSQEAFVRVRAYAEVEVHRPRALLITIAANAARDADRRAAVRAPDARAAVEIDAGVAWADGDQESAVLLRQVILGLPPKLREVFVLARFEGLTAAEIGRRLGISTKTVEGRMTRALAICAARLRD